MWCKQLSTFNQTIRRVSQAVSSKKSFVESSDFKIFQKGHKEHGFVVNNVTKVDELKLTAIYLTHEKTLAEYLHIYRDDPNNVFSINFRTTPQNSTGLPHILEHIVLCGSKMYPVRDPFFKMLNRSLATFMNAMTGSDYTMYPFSTQNLSDYRNLQQIYLDAVFQPNLHKLDFMQEGWRLENVDVKDKTTPIIIKGVVYNEMKGAFAENESLLSQKLLNFILPDHTYGVISGGDPMEIPNLTWEDLTNFHRNYYHPSNTKFYSYGNFSLSPSLDYINKNYLSNFELKKPDYTAVPFQKRWSEQKRKHISGRFLNMGEPFEKQNIFSISLLLSDITQIYDTFLMSFITELLIKGPSAPFYKTMIEPNFSKGFTLSTGYDTQPRDSIFTLGLQGLKTEDFDKVSSLFDSTLDEVIAKGFDEKHIESVLHRYELSLKHESSNFGLHILFGLTPTWNHNGDIMTALQVNQLIERLKKEMKENNRYLQENVKKYFKDNKHRLILTMSPDKDYEQKLQQQEVELIKQKTINLTDIQKEEIFSNCLQLQESQNKQQNTDLLPTLQMSDIDHDVEKILEEKVTINSVPVQINKVNSNGIVYFNGLLSTSELSAEQQMLLPLFCHVINKLGTDKLNYKDFDNSVNRATAGLQIETHIGESLFHLNNYESSIHLSSYCLENNLEKMWNLWIQLFNLSNLSDVDRFQMLTEMYMANLTHGLADYGHKYAIQAASALVSATSYQKELLTGFQHISYMKRLIGTQQYRAVLDEILNIAKIVFSRNNIRCALNISSKSQPKVLKSFAQFTSQLPQTQNSCERSYIDGKICSSIDAVNCQYHILSVPVNYCSKSVLTVPYTTQDYARLRVLARLISAKYLHPELRERQGAYGAGAALTRDGVFAFYSYRDPHNLKTLDIFDNTYKWIDENLSKVTDQEILESKLGVFQTVDSPVPPSHKGNEAFLNRLTPSVLQRHRVDLMNVDKKGLKEVAEKFLGQENFSTNGKVILGNKSEVFETNVRSNELWTFVEYE